MTGPEHCQEAEKLLHLANQGHNQDSEREDRLVAQAQVHATLAVAAAQDRLATFADTIGQVAVHTVFAGWSEDEVRAAQQWVRQASGMAGGDQS